MAGDFDVTKVRRNGGEQAIFIVAFILFTIYTLSLFFVLSWGFLNSLKTNLELLNDPMKLPKRWLISNYIVAFEELTYEDTNFLGMLFNSLWLTVGASILSTIMVSVTGYVFAKYRFRGKEAIFSFVIFTMIIPLLANLPAMYKLIYELGINDSPLYLITALGGFGGNFLIMYAFFKGVDWSYAESSFIDGGGHFVTFWTVMFPLAKGPVLALFILSLIGVWNDYLTPLLYLPRMPTVATGIYFYKEKMNYESNLPAYFAGVIMSMIPAITLFAIFSRSIMTNVIIGGLKG